MKADALLRVLLRAPLSYRVVRQRGSHRRLVSANGYRPITYAYHGRTVDGARVRQVLVDQVGLTVDQALSILGR